MHVEGVVETGIRVAALFVERYNPWFERALGFKAFPGTMNVRVKEELGLMDGIIVEPPGGGRVTCYSATVSANGKRVKGAVVVPDRTAHRGVLEFIAPVNAREALGVRDGDAVVLHVRETLSPDGRSCC